MNLKNKGKTHKRTNSNSGNNSNAPSANNQSNTDMMLQNNAINQNTIPNNVTIGARANQIENNSSVFQNQGIVQSKSKNLFLKKKFPKFLIRNN